MYRSRVFPKISVLSLLVSQAFLIPSAFAAGFQINELSPGLQGSALAGAAATKDDVSSMFINPAILSTLEKGQIYIGGSEIMPSLKMTSASATHTVNVPGFPPSSITAPVAGETSQNSVAKAAFVPNGYFGWRFNDRWSAGIALVAPFGLTTSYDDNSVVRFMADNSEVEAIVINPAVSVAITEKWSVAVGFQAEYLQGTFSNFNGPYTGISSIDALTAATNATYVKASSWGYGYTFGTLIQPDQVTRLGLGFRSQVSQQLSGNGRQFLSPGGVTPAPSADFLFNASTRNTAAIKTPAVLALSAARDIGKWTVKATGQVTFWDSFNQLSVYMPDAFATHSVIATHWRNSWLASVGADYRINTKWTVRGGLAYDQTPTQDAYRDPRIPDADRVWLSLGASYKANNHWSVDGAYTHLFVSNPSVNVTQASGSSATSSGPLEVNQVTANYRGHIDIVGLAARYSF